MLKIGKNEGEWNVFVIFICPKDNLVVKEKYVVCYIVHGYVKYIRMVEGRICNYIIIGMYITDQAT